MCQSMQTGHPFVGKWQQLRNENENIWQIPLEPQRDQMTRKNVPWRDSGGKPLPIEALKRVSRRWRCNTWERYLNSIGTPQREIVTGKYELLLQRCGKFPATQNPESNGLSNRSLDLAPVLSSLNPTERLIIEGVFWEGRSERELGRILNMERRTVRSHKGRALKKLKRLLSPTIGKSPCRPF